MFKPTSILVALTLSVTILTASPLAMAIDPGLTAQQLDNAIDELVIDACTVPEMFAKLSDSSGINIRIEDHDLDKLPWGARTKVSTLSLRNTTLRDALPKILAPIALQYSIDDDGIIITPLPPLERRTSPSTWDDLKLITSIYAMPFSLEAFDQLPIDYRLSSKLNYSEALRNEMQRSSLGDMADIIETATGSLGWTWVVEDGRVVVLTKQAAIARQMARKMNGRYVRRHLGEILFELGQEVDVHVHLQPGTFKQLPQDVVQQYSLFLTNSSIRQVFDYIAADTGLAYRIETDGIHVGPAENIKEMAVSAQEGGNSDPYVAKISIPAAGGTSYEFLIRRSELPDDVLEMRQRALDAFIEQARK